MDDVLNDALSNLEHDNYEISYKGYENRQADIALIRTALAAHKPDGGEVEVVLRQFLTEDGFIAECDIPHIVAALTAQPDPNVCYGDAFHDGYWKGREEGWDAAMAAQPAASAEPSDEEIDAIAASMPDGAGGMLK